MKTFKPGDLVVLQVEFLKFGAFFKAIHLLNHVRCKVNLDNVRAAFKRRLSNESKVVILQEDVCQAHTELAQERFDFLFLVDSNQRAKSLLLHL